jgi:hypothetical protein
MTVRVRPYHAAGLSRSYQSALHRAGGNLFGLAQYRPIDDLPWSFTGFGKSPFLIASYTLLRDLPQMDHGWAK